MGSEPEAGRAKADDSRFAPAGDDLAQRAAELKGAHALKLISVVNARVGDDEEVRSLVTEIDALVIVAPSGSAINLSMRPCRAQLPEVSGRTPTLDQKIIRALPTIEIQGRLEHADDGTVALHADNAAILLGVELDDPLGDALPVSDDDPRVVDLDRDRLPGVSVEISGFSIYAVARVGFWLSGTVGANGDHVAGDAGLDLDLQILGDNIPFFDAREAAAESAAESVIIDQQHGFDLTRVPDSVAACEDLDRLNGVKPAE